MIQTTHSLTHSPMEDIWKRAKLFAEEAAKKSQTLSSSSHRIADLVAETAKKSKELALEASKKADQLKTAAFKQADQIPFKSIADVIPQQLSSLSFGNANPLTSTGSSVSELQRFGITDDLREFVRGLTSATFQNFPIQEDVDVAGDLATTASNVRKDLNEWQEKHATLVLSTVKQISRLRYELCPRVMKERRFWRIYFTLVSTHVAPYEKEYMEEVKLREEEQLKQDKVKQSEAVGEELKSDMAEKSKTSTASTDQDIDTFLLGEFEDSDDGADDGDADASFDDDFDKIDNSDIEDEKHSKKPTTATSYNTANTMNDEET